MKVVVPKGDYYLGDPCYIIQDSDWDNLLESSDCFRKPVGIVRTFQVLAFSTAFGDGEFKDNYNNSYSVDSGLIGLVPVEFNPEADSTKVSFKKPTICRSVEGVLIFGNIVIDTN